MVLPSALRHPCGRQPLNDVPPPPSGGRADKSKGGAKAQGHDARFISRGRAPSQPGASQPGSIRPARPPSAEAPAAPSGSARRPRVRSVLPSARDRLGVFLRAAGRAASGCGFSPTLFPPGSDRGRRHVADLSRDGPHGPAGLETPMTMRCVRDPGASRRRTLAPRGGSGGRCSGLRHPRAVRSFAGHRQLALRHSTPVSDPSQRSWPCRPASRCAPRRRFRFTMPCNPFRTSLAGDGHGPRHWID